MHRFVLITFTLFLHNNSFADSWGNPEIKNYYSSNGKYYVRIFPLKTPERYYRWLGASFKRKRKFKPEGTLQIPCSAKLYKVKVCGDSLIWDQQLINWVAPTTAIVSNDGKHMVTFDNWYSLGYGMDVMVCYNEKGELTKRYKLEEISPFPINTYRRTMSSLWWRCSKNFIDNEKISLCFIDKNNATSWRAYDLLRHRMEEFIPLGPPPTHK